MYGPLRSTVTSVETFLTHFEPGQVSGPDAIALVDTFAKLERLAAAGRTLAARRVEETKAWHGAGYRRLSDWMAARAGTTIGTAVATLETGRRLDSLPATRRAFVSGELSAQQAHHVTAAAAADPSAEHTMLEAAQKDSVNSLRLQSQQVIAAASSDLDEDERRHRSRYFSVWPQDGMIRFEGATTIDAGAKLMTVVDSRAQELLIAARAAGSRERREAYAADALVSLADGAMCGPKAVVNVLVDYEAIKRGTLQSGDRCAIPGIGPVSLEATKRLAEEGLIRLILCEDADVRSVVTLGQTVTPKQQAALEARDPVCVVPNCNETKNLENHHYTEPYLKSRRTRLNDLCRVCHWHHLIITHRGWRIIGRPGEWELVPPERVGIPLPSG